MPGASRNAFLLYAEGKRPGLGSIRDSLSPSESQPLIRLVEKIHFSINKSPQWFIQVIFLTCRGWQAAAEHLLCRAAR